MKRIGIDIGRVIIAGDTDKEDNLFFSPKFIQASQVKNAFICIKKIVNKLGAENVFLVSKCGSQTEQRTLKWLEYNDFYKETGVKNKNIYFCRERKEKKEICSLLGINIFIDDRFSVLEHLEGFDSLYLFNPLEEEKINYNLHADKQQITIVYIWKDLITSFLKLQKRNRKIYLGLIIITIIFGLLSRTNLIPEIIYPYLGDYLYALMFFFIIAFLFPNMETLKVALVSVSICYIIEFSQLYQSEWITIIRNNKLGGLVLGFGFLWSDIISYTLGGISGFLLEKIYYKRNKIIIK